MKKEDYLIVYGDKSILKEDDISYAFIEGPASAGAKERLSEVKSRLDDGFLREIIEECKTNPNVLSDKNISMEHMAMLKELINYTSEVGRALVGLTILQLCIKAIRPDQSIRLHKSSTTLTGFSWTEGMPMRVLDKKYITPVLREYGLLSLNADGFMMTRSLAENYPYSKVYKAAIKGSRVQWLQIVDELESKRLNGTLGIYHLITLLINKSKSFQKSTEIVTSNMNKFIEKKGEFNNVIKFMEEFIEKSSYSARIFELALHSLYQVLDEENQLPGKLKPLTQMRSANKKHGNIGDVEVIMGSSKEACIIQAWDAKYGKTYLRDELEELSEKLFLHPETEDVGFVVDKLPDLKPEINNRLSEIKNEHDVNIHILSFVDWVKMTMDTYSSDTMSSHVYSVKWLIAFVESLSQKRREIAPLDEPCDEWIAELNKTFLLALEN